MSFQIPVEEIKKYCLRSTYEGGIQIYRSNLVRKLDIHYKGDQVELRGQVQAAHGGNLYQVNIEYDPEQQELSSCSCDCQDWGQYRFICRHSVAVMQEYNHRVGRGNLPKEFLEQRKTSRLVRRVIEEHPQQAAARFAQKRRLEGEVRLEPTLHWDRYDSSWSVSFRIGTDAQLYVVRNLSQLVRAVQTGANVSYGKKLEFVHNRSAFAPQALPFLDLISASIHMEWALNSKNRSYYTSETKHDLILTDAMLLHILDCAGDQILVSMEGTGAKHAALYSIQHPAALRLPIEFGPQDSGYRLSMPMMQFISDGARDCVALEGQFLFLQPEWRDAVQEICGLASPGRREEHFIAAEDLPAFCATLLPQLQKSCVLDLDGLEEMLPEECQLRVYIDDDGRQILCRAEAWYGAHCHQFRKTEENTELWRDLEKEYTLRYVLERYFPAWNDYGELYFSYEEDARLYQLLVEGIPEIGRLADVYLSERMQTIQVRPQPKMQIGVRLKSGILEMDIDAERLPQQELEALLQSYRLRKRYYRMKNGDFLQLEEGALATFAELADGLNLSGAQIRQGQLELPAYKAVYVDQVLRDGGETLSVERDNSFRSMIRDLKNFEDSDDEVPAGLQTSLRQYQEVGYRWLMTLQRMGLGGVLADDMGLGKTVQVIALFLANAARLWQKPALVVAPASLVYNWESELHRFAPELRVQVVAGTISLRREQLQSSAQIYLTSYELLRRDCERYKDREFLFVILDEAQKIKNHATKVSQAVKALRAENRFVLTGTPIENNLAELWNIFDFLMPGYLGRYDAFRKHYETAIVLEKDEVALKQLQRMIQPFLLRRLKKDVLKDLPEKLETVVYSKMEPEQRALYVAQTQQMLDMLHKQSEEQVHTQKIAVLAGLTRLRQICCDPALIYENYTGGSAKMETCLELISGVLSAGGKVLVFSQFATMLKHIRARLEEMRIGSYLMTGETSKEQRAEMVRDFGETPDVKVFLISLRAGGTGLNLTAANTVIHVDPWWNAAAQEQASDRAHRIGQKETVTVIQLITQDTLEERIYALQQRKQELSESVINFDKAQNASLAGLDKEELLELLQISEGLS